MPDLDEEVRRGAAVYGKAMLNVYDLYVVCFSNTFVWRCHRKRMLAHYEQSLGRRHLDVGPGTGWYLGKARMPAGTEVTLMDLNENSLAAASKRVSGADPHSLVGNVLEPLPDGAGPFDSIGVNFLLHCVPGGWEEKGAAFGHLAAGLAPDGVLFGSTVLGRGVRHNVAGRRLMGLYNGKGIFHNTADDREGLERALGAHFSEVDVEVIGTVALFRASDPAHAPE